MRAGQLRHRLTIQQAPETTNDSGEAIATWSDLKTVWGSLEPQSSTEVDRADTTVALLTNRIVIRHTTGITPKMRIKFGTRVMQIESIADPDGRRRELVIVATEEVAT